MGRTLFKAKTFSAEGTTFTEVTHSLDETLQEALTRRYPKYAENFCTRFLEATGTELTWENISMPNLDKFVQYLSACGLSPNTVNQYCKKLKATLNCYSDIHPMPQGFMKMLSTPKDDSQETYLTDDDIDALYSYLDKISQSPAFKMRTEILSQFLIGIETGARHSDYVRFNDKNISDSVDSEGNPIKVLTYVSVKKGIKAQVPLDSESPILSIIDNIPEERISTVYFDRIIKEICRDAGLTRVIKRHHAGIDEERQLWETISSHSARRSFCTNQLKRGANIIDVMHFMGHSNTNQTLGYNCAGPQFEAKSILKRKTNKEKR